MFRFSALTVGIILDWIFGEPKIFLHPVVLIGKLISHTEHWLRKKLPEKEREAGFLLVLIVIFFSTLIPAAVLWAAFCLEGRKGPLCWCFTAFWCFQLLAAKGLYQESKKVGKALEASDLEGAKKQVSMIVGRDTEPLDQSGVIRAAVETVAENTSDGVLAPLLYMVVFGILGVFFYKAVNTMDSMVGYKNKKYYWFGHTAAKLDDICNFIPARITGFLLIGAAWILGSVCNDYDGKNAWNIYRRDRLNHASPNSAHGEAACAGALHIRLAGPAWYFGERVEKPYIGQDDRQIETADIKRAGKLMILSEILGLLCCVGLSYWLGLL
ncbi:MAG: cobalamin biosynthesis protein CobD [Lachnospiraceae bacterium]|nr:cobalamin biosynthesis protein CobD [Lachnospiraceae bacterium]